MKRKWSDSNYDWLKREKFRLKMTHSVDVLAQPLNKNKDRTIWCWIVNLNNSRIDKELSHKQIQWKKLIETSPVSKMWLILSFLEKQDLWENKVNMTEKNYRDKQRSVQFSFMSSLFILACIFRYIS